ncbi:MAG: hypothetical protein ACJATD_000557 [Alloalcanivorax sp.]|jgi:hypothetical protein
MPPNFLICGAPRSGTTFLAKNLAAHPDVYLCSGDEGEAGGDVHFFDVDREDGYLNFGKGFEWYLERFRNAQGEHAVGEKTADYLSDSRAPYLIKKYLGDVKIILVLRDPVERAVSHFWHSRHRMHKVDTFEEILLSPDIMSVDILSDGFYWRHISRYLKVFDRSQVLVLINEMLLADPQSELKKACSFLNVNPEFLFPFVNERINAGSSSQISYLVAKFGRAIRIRYPRLYSVILKGGLGPTVVRLVKLARGKKEHDTAVSRKSPYPQISRDTIESLRSLYLDDVSMLSDYLGQDLRRFWWY